MNSTHLNEHDANQGAQSSGEFLGMTGNSGWYLLGSGGATILMVIVLWGILGVSLLLCLLMGIVLGLLSVAYVFALKNNRPEHYDADFFESALVEAGVLPFSFGPRVRRPQNPFAEDGLAAVPITTAEKRRAQSRPAGRSRIGAVGAPVAPAEPAVDEARAKPKAARPNEGVTIIRDTFERLQEKLTTTEEMLEEVLAEGAEG